MSQGLLDSYEAHYAALVRRLRQARSETGLTQDEVALRLGKHQSFVSRSEQGIRRVDVIELQAFAKIYNKDLSYFFDDPSIDSARQRG